jgi:hypothetical protein
MTCVREHKMPDSLREITHIELRDDDKYELTCQFGHKTTTILQQLRFEILFDIGAHAILDGYYREAVLSFTSSLERFYEFAIRVFLNKISKSDDLFQNCWKKISSQSERQYGAFIFLWASFFNGVPELLSGTQIEFRNDVIHKGRIPSRDEAFKYGETILGIVNPKIILMQEILKVEIENVVFYHLHKCKTISDHAEPVATMCEPTILSLSVGDKTHYQKTLEQHLVDLNRWRKIVDDAKKKC